MLSEVQFIRDQTFPVPNTQKSRILLFNFSFGFQFVSIVSKIQHRKKGYPCCRTAVENLWQCPTELVTIVDTMPEGDSTRSGIHFCHISTLRRAVAWRHCLNARSVRLDQNTEVSKPVTKVFPNSNDEIALEILFFSGLVCCPCLGSVQQRGSWSCRVHRWLARSDAMIFEYPFP